MGKPRWWAVPAAQDYTLQLRLADTGLELFSYVIARDYGFAPNPFFGCCTLATCKPNIRRVAEIGDWIVGTGSAARKRKGFLIFAMCVNETMQFNEYWEDPRFQQKNRA